MDLQLDAEESASMLAALRSYCGDLRMEIVDTDNPAYKRDLKHEHELLLRVLDKLDHAPVPADVAVRFIAVWSS